jgi:hypothetical protein
MLSYEPTESLCPTALVFETTVEARMLLEGDDELADASRAAEEAAYYLSDTMEPDERADLLAIAATRPRPDDEHGRMPTQDRAAEALTLLSDAAEEVQEILRGPHASSELQIALRALRRGVDTLASRAGIEANSLYAPRVTPFLALRRLRPTVEE